MKRKVSTKELTVGMHIAEICGSWLNHPFWRSSFLVKDEKQIRELVRAGVTEVWIDDSKGVGVVVKVENETEDRAEVGQNPIKNEEPKRSFKEEAEFARKLKARAKEAMRELYEDARMGAALNVEGAANLVNEISGSLTRNSNALLNVMKLKNADDYTYFHSVAVCALMISLARELRMGEDEVRLAGTAGLMHDVGKAFMPMDVLNKPGKLTDEEFETIKAHPMEGWKAASAANGADSVVADVCRHHHEKTDGSGYPDGLSGDEISVYAKMGAICDVYDAITSNRCYKKGWGAAESIRRMAEWQAGHFDERIFKAFVKTVGIYPTGTLLNLRAGKLAIVTGQSGRGLLKPSAVAFYSWRGNERLLPEKVVINGADDVMGTEKAEDWGFDEDFISSMLEAG